MAGLVPGRGIEPRRKPFGLNSQCMSIENWISLAGAVTAFGSFLAALWQARSAHKSQEASAESASRSASAAESASEAQRRIATALEKIGSRYPMPWRIEHFRGDAFLLINDSDEPVFNVALDVESPIKRGDFSREVMQPGDSMKFIFLSSEPDRAAIVQWTRQGEEAPRVWNGHVPPTQSR